MLGRGLATQQNGSFCEAVFGKPGFDVSGANKGKVSLGVDVPIAFVLLIRVENVLGGGEERFVFIVGTADFAQEEGQIRLLCKSGQLGGVIEPYVEEALDSVGFQNAEELTGALLGETDAVDLH